MQPPSCRDVDALELCRLAQLGHLALGQLHVIVFEAGEALVLPLKHPAQEDAHHGRERLEPDADAQGHRVVIALGLVVGERRPDTGGVSDAVHKRKRGGAFSRWPRDSVGDPGVAGAVHDEDEVHQEEAEVARAEGVGRHEDDEPDDRDWHRVHEEPEPIAHAVGGEGVRERVEGDEDVRGRHQQQRDDVRVAQRRCQGGEEVLEARGARDRVVGDSEDVRLRVHEGQLHAPDLAHGSRLVDVRLGRVDGQSSIRDPLHLGAQCPPRVWEIGQQNNDHESNEDRDGSLDDIQPLPRIHSIGSLEAGKDACCDEVAKGAGDEGSRVEDGHA